LLNKLSNTIPHSKTTHSLYVWYNIRDFIPLAYSCLRIASDGVRILL